MKDVLINLHTSVNGAYAKFFTDVPNDEVDVLIEGVRHLDANGEPRERIEGIKPFDNIRNVQIVDIGK